MARVLVVVTGGMAAYKAFDLVRLFVKGGHDVVTLVTPGAELFVTAETFFAVARRSHSAHPHLHHTTVVLLVLAPLTTNSIAELAHGLPDDLETYDALAHSGPAFRASEMNPRMWASAPTQSHPAALLARGALFVG